MSLSERNSRVKLCSKRCMQYVQANEGKLNMSDSITFPVEWLDDPTKTVLVNSSLDHLFSITDSDCASDTVGEWTKAIAREKELTQ